MTNSPTADGTISAPASVPPPVGVDGGDVPPAAVWIVVVTWNGRGVVGACLASLLPAVSRGHRVLVVDNASEDGTPELVEREFPGVELIRNEKNLGFAGGNNVGLRHALGRGADYMVLLNQDAVVAPDAIEELVACAERHPDAGTVTAKIFFLDRPQRLWFAGSTLSIHTGRTRHLGYGRIDSGQFDDERVIPRGCACAMLIRRQLVERVGLFDEALFLYNEEIDLALRSRGSGFVDRFAPRAHVWHRVSTGTGGASSGEYLYYHTRNMLYVLDRHAPIRSRVGSGARLGMIALSMLVSIVTMRTSPRRSLYAVAQGVYDFSRGRTGKRSVSSPPPSNT